MLPTVDVRVLIAENDDTVAGMLQRSLEDQGHSVERFTNGRDALRAIQEFAFDVALLGLDLPAIDGLEVLRRARQDPFPPECIIFASHATINTAVAAMRAGAHDYLEPPYRPEEIDGVVRRAAEAKRMRFDNARMRRRLFGRPSLPAPESAARSMQTALLAAERAAQSLGSVLIVGEPGTGKSSIARYLHDVSPRGQGPMVKVKCGRLERSRALAALFSTSVTATESKASDGPRTVGAFEEAAGGTVVLCDVEWMDDPSQSALAAALASGFFRREGARAQLPVEARVIATTLTAMGDHHELRTDLLEQLSGDLIALPPLRARAADILPIAERYVREAAPLAAHALTDAAQAALLEYHWPGNLRELRAVMARAVAIAPRDVIDAKHLLLPAHASVELAAPQDESLDAVEWQHIQVVLERTGRHQGRAAERLGISAKTLYRKIREYGVPRDESAGSV